MHRKRILGFFLLLATFSNPAFADLEFETVKEKPVGPGMVYSHIVEKTQPWSIHLLQIDLHNPYLIIESVKAKETVAGREPTDTMAKQRDWEGHFVVGAVNADFYEPNDESTNAQVAQGELVHLPIKRFSALAFTDDHQPAIEQIDFRGVLLAGDTALIIDDINRPLSGDRLHLFNRFSIDSPQNRSADHQVQIHPLETWLANDTLLCAVDSISSSNEVLPIPAGGAVLAASGLAAGALNRVVAQGDTLRLVLQLSPLLPERIKELVGGYPRIIRDGKNYVRQGLWEENHVNPTDTRNPRTAAGFTADSSKLFLVAIDGRQEHSAGMSWVEWADYLLSLGLYQAINLDGGGSTAMIIRGEVVNIPSDGYVRPVANALCIVSSAPRDEITQLAIEPSALRLLPGDTAVFRVTGLDRFYNPQNLALQDVQIGVPAAVGTWCPGKGLIAALTPDSGFVSFRYGDAIDSVKVIVKAIDHFSVSPGLAVVDTSTDLSLSAEVIDSDHELHIVAARWAVQDSSIGKVRGNLFRARRQGETAIIGSYLGLTDTLWVRVELGIGQRLLDGFEDESSWTLHSVNCDSSTTALRWADAPVTQGDRALAADYRFAYQAGVENWLDLSCDQLIYGVPDSLCFDLYLDDLIHTPYIEVTTAQGEQVRLSPRRRPRTTQSYNRVAVALPMVPAVESHSRYPYPLRLTGITIRLASALQSGLTYSGSLYLDNLVVSYPAESPVKVFLHPERLPSKMGLLQSYPNPFNDQTILSFNLLRSGMIKIFAYDLLGRQSRLLYSGYRQQGEHHQICDFTSLPSGIYFIALDPMNSKPLAVTLIR